MKRKLKMRQYVFDIRNFLMSIRFGMSNGEDVTVRAAESEEDAEKSGIF